MKAEIRDAMVRARVTSQPKDLGRMLADSGTGTVDEERG
jgi:hypothetical protein